MMEMDFKREIEVTVDLAKRAAFATEQIRENGVEALNKDDGSPVTQADIVSQAIILAGLWKAFPEDKIAAEETLKPGREKRLRQAACSMLKDLRMNAAEDHLEQWVNYRGNITGTRLWMIDPIDGTKGFKRGLCYAIALGLFFDDRPRFGCMAVPAFPDAGAKARKTVIAYAGTGVGAYRLDPGDKRPQRLHVSDFSRIPDLKLVGSRAHDQKNICRRFMQKTGLNQFIPMDGQAKYLMLATAQADLYLRGSDQVFGIGYPWDHCAGQVILEEAGGLVTGFAGERLNYEQAQGSPIKDSVGLIASNRRCHEQVLGIVREIA